MKRWTIAAAAVAIFFYVLAIDNDVYAATSPAWLSWHVLLRKVYSVVAFSIVASLLRRAIVENGGSRTIVPCIAGVACYSAAIEVGQYLHGSTEGLGWNTFDTFCGALGGAIAVVDRIAPRKPVARD